MHEYEEVMNRLIIENEKSKESCNGVMVDLRRERDQALDDLQSVETAFSDLHKRYEKCKSVVDAYRKNEETLKSCMLDYQEKLVKNDEKYKSFKQMAEQKINLANAEIDKVKKSSDSEIKVLQIAIRKLEMKAEGLQKSIEQKTLENTELTAICDELLSKAK
ncbi:hypothetical protein HELRODRAFT_104333 [Helobdella robusta]|uniref:Transforming acidic coiled-coil-containing protein C-terminal domain-containing protein n=1 Tax=Helobdella robusta TaxID=6412 RepID=T1EDL1_HELRO|nr:hypothetical protein HELRODRAFT_104333 [Helobdella robusta]ESN90817.1 hypothetical protein HELRODRAFT_104333 [Helobdella robusta]